MGAKHRPRATHQPPSTQVVDLCECSLFDALHAPSSQLLQPRPGPGGAVGPPTAAHIVAALQRWDPHAQGPAALARLCESRAFDRQLLLGIMRQVADAIAYLHSLTPAIVHRDIKSHNVLLTTTTHGSLDPGGPASDGAGAGPGAGVPTVSARLCDFGLASASASDAGTPNYMAPELFLRKPFSKAVDVYALGVLLWEVWVGEVPFDGYSAADIRKQVVAGERPSLPRSMPDALGDVILSCWAQDPQARSSATTVHRSLAAIYDRAAGGRQAAPWSTSPPPGHIPGPGAHQGSSPAALQASGREAATAKHATDALDRLFLR